MSEHKHCVSVVIPCYNDGKYLQEAVDSVFNSTWKNIEVVIVDDGSTDKTEKVGLQLAAKHPQVVYHRQQNAGLPTARNTGIDLASGGYILPLDADDKISADYIQMAMEVLQINAHVKVVYCEAEFFGLKAGKWELPEFSRSKLARENLIFCSGVYRKSCWMAAGGYSTEMKGGWEDWEFWISMLKNGGEAVKLPITGFYYRIKQNSMRKGMTKEKKARLIQFLNSRHSDFFIKELNGPLRTSRSLSRPINLLSNLFTLSRA